MGIKKCEEKSAHAILSYRNEHTQKRKKKETFARTSENRASDTMNKDSWRDDKITPTASMHRLLCTQYCTDEIPE